MSPAPAWRRYLSFWGARVADDFDDEVRFHLDMRIEDFKRLGATEAEARALALQRIGDVALVRDRCVTIASRREQRMARARTLEAFTQDVRYGARQLRRNPGWTAVATVTLALGIGAATAVFSVINSLILNPLPYRDADRVANVMRTDPLSHISMSPGRALLQAWQGNLKTVESIEEFATRTSTVSIRNNPARMEVGLVTPSFLRFTGMSMVRGRFFAPEEATRGANRTALLTEQTWRTAFGGDSSAVGSTIRIDDVPYTVIGVTPARLRFPLAYTDPFTVLIPLDTTDKFLASNKVVRVREGVSMEAAATELDMLASRISPNSPGRSKMKITLQSASDMIWFKQQIYLVAGAVGLLLFIACANVAHLLLARGAARERELAIRAAVGAGAGRLLRQLLTESGILALAGCALGIGLGALGIRLLVAFRPERMQPLGYAFMDWRALAAAVAVSVLTGLAFGLTGAIHVLRRRSTTLLGSASQPTSNTRQRLRSVLVVSEMALSAVLLVGALLLAHSIMNRQQVDPGFDARDLYTMRVELPTARYKDARADEFTRELRRRVAALPGVTAATVANSPPPQYGFMNGLLSIEGRPVDEKAQPFIAVNWVDADYFDAIGLRMFAGRTFAAGKASDNEVIINIGAAKKLWGSDSPIGKRLRILSPGLPPDSLSWSRVVGVVGDLAAGNLTSDRTDPMIYMPRSSIQGMTNFSVVMRARPAVNPSQGALLAARELDPLLAPPSIKSVQQTLSEAFAQTRFTMLIMTAFAAIAVVLSAIGLYGVIAYAVAQRTREIGIRIALGATRRDIGRRVAGQGLTLVGIGLAIGLVGGVFAAKLIAAMLFGVTARDPLVLTSTTVVLATVALLATLVPMRRATRVDPAIAMRAD